jgi:hypothetical protein
MYGWFQLCVQSDYDLVFNSHEFTDGYFRDLARSKYKISDLHCLMGRIFPSLFIVSHVEETPHIFIIFDQESMYLQLCLEEA